MLGCGEARVEVRRLDRWDSDGPISPPVLDGFYDLAGVRRVSAIRTFNSWGPLEIEVDETCDILPLIRPGWWEIRIFRGNESVITGVIHSIRRSGGASPRTVITGGDLLSVFYQDAGRLVNLLDMNYVDMDPVDIAADVIRRALAETTPPDIHLLTDYLYTNPVGENIDYAPRVRPEYVGDTLDDLTQYGLMTSVIGRRIILSSLATLDRDPVATLTDAHILGDPEIVTTIIGMGTLGVAVGEDQDGTTQVTTYGTNGSPWGAPAAIVDVDRGVSARTRATAARRAIAGITRPLTSIEMPTSVQLTPDAPISIHNLRPGSARVDVEIHDTPQPVRQAMMLSEVGMEWVDGEERITVSLSPIGDVTPIP